ncbi:MAG: inositol monophosphatase [Patescibacteria group bacterium]
MQNYQKELEIAINVAREAGPIMLKYFDCEQEVEFKDERSFLTIADKLINTLVINKLRAAFPEDGVIGEEESTTGYGMGRKWICDPIDGTAGYVWGTPTAMFSLALIVDGVPVVGVTYDPFLNKIYAGIKGDKSYCNDEEIHVSEMPLENGIVAINGNIRSMPEKSYYINVKSDKTIRLATFSGLVYKAMLVAKGKMVACIGPVHLHDIAAAHVIVENAGGKVTAGDGSLLDYSKPFVGVIVVSNKIVHEQLVEYCK